MSDPPEPHPKAPPTVGELVQVWLTEPAAAMAPGNPIWGRIDAVETGLLTLTTDRAVGSIPAGAAVGVPWHSIAMVVRPNPPAAALLPAAAPQRQPSQTGSQ